MIEIMWRCRGCTEWRKAVPVGDIEALVVAREEAKAIAAAHARVCPRGPKNVEPVLESWPAP